MKSIGILALQGDFEKHAGAIEKLNHQPVLVKDAVTLAKCERLIIPGGESTTFLKLIDRHELRKPIIEFSKHKPIFGTCAGLIILAKTVADLKQEPLGLIDISVKRNAYGRQIDSFIDTIDLSFNGSVTAYEAVFIRAPKITKLNPDVVVLAKHSEDVVMAYFKNILVASFHPELTSDTRIHDFFVNRFNA